MKGVVLAAGLGTRLRPLTSVTTKQLLPVYDRPMIEHPIRALAGAGITEIMVVVGGPGAGDLVSYLGDGSRLGVTLEYGYQREPKGIAHALAVARGFAAGEPVALLLGDNLFQDELGPAVRAFEARPEGATVFLKEVPEPRHYGVALLEGDRVVRILEKPTDPPSPFAVVGIYLYDTSVFDRIETLVPSARGELEVTDLNNTYARDGLLRHRVLDGWWIDAGASFDNLLRAGMLVAGVVG